VDQPQEVGPGLLVDQVATAAVALEAAPVAAEEPLIVGPDPEPVAQVEEEPAPAPIAESLSLPVPEPAAAALTPPVNEPEWESEPLTVAKPAEPEVVMPVRVLGEPDWTLETAALAPETQAPEIASPHAETVPEEVVPEPLYPAPQLEIAAETATAPPPLEEPADTAPEATIVQSSVDYAEETWYHHDSVEDELQQLAKRLAPGHPVRSENGWGGQNGGPKVPQPAVTVSHTGQPVATSLALIDERPMPVPPLPAAQGVAPLSTPEALPWSEEEEHPTLRIPIDAVRMMVSPAQRDLPAAVDESVAASFEAPQPELEDAAAPTVIEEGAAVATETASVENTSVVEVGAGETMLSVLDEPTIEELQPLAELSAIPANGEIAPTLTVTDQTEVEEVRAPDLVIAAAEEVLNEQPSAHGAVEVTPNECAPNPRLVQASASLDEQAASETSIAGVVPQAKAEIVAPEEPSFAELVQSKQDETIQVVEAAEADLQSAAPDQEGAEASAFSAESPEPAPVEHPQAEDFPTEEIRIPTLPPSSNVEEEAALPELELHPPAAETEATVEAFDVHTHSIEMPQESEPATRLEAAEAVLDERSLPVEEPAPESNVVDEPAAGLAVDSSEQEDSVPELSALEPVEPTAVSEVSPFEPEPAPTFVLAGPRRDLVPTFAATQPERVEPELPRIESREPEFTVLPGDAPSLEPEPVYGFAAQPSYSSSNASDFVAAPVPEHLLEPVVEPIVSGVPDEPTQLAGFRSSVGSTLRRLAPIPIGHFILGEDPVPSITLPGPMLPPKLDRYLEGTILVGVGAAQNTQNKKSSGWMITFLVAMIVLTAGVGFLKNSIGAPAESDAPAEKPKPAAVQQTTVSHPLAKYLEITGVRVVVDYGKKSQVQYVVVNHSPAEIADVMMNVTVRADNKSQPICTFAFKLSSLGPFESKDMSMPIEKPARGVDLPDWQQLRTEFQISAQ
jgi:hypothetical protein